jgi:hypothetical protein
LDQNRRKIKTLQNFSVCVALCVAHKKVTSKGESQMHGTGEGLKIGEAHLSYDRGFSFFSLNKARSDTPDTFTTLKRTPGMSPTA